jgi:erythromycin esterase
VRALYDGIERLDKPGSDITAAGLVDGARKAFALIEGQRGTLALTPDDYRDLHQSARIVLQALEMRADIGERDRAMAENVRWLLEERFPGQKIVLWAHNRHIGTNLECSARSLGDHLRDRYGDQMAIIGFATHHGEVRAIRMKDGKFQRGGPVALPLMPASGVSVEALFQEMGLARFILDLRNLPEDSAVSGWLAKPRSHREIGAVYDPDRDANYYEHVRLPAMFDCVVFIAESTAAKPLKSGAA